MRIAFFSNFLNAHQLPLSNEFDAMEGVDYTFVSLLATDGMVGRESLDDDYNFVIKEYDGEAEVALAMRHAVEDEIVIFGDMAGKEQYVRARAKTGKPFFRYAERLLKRGDWWRFALPKIYRTWNQFGRYKKDEIRVLCASAYTARDLGLFGFPVSKCFKWGYFPQVRTTNGTPDSKTPLQRYKALCSAQRLIPLKRVDLQIHALQRVLSAGADATLTIAGDGPEKQKLEELASRLGVAGNVEFLGELSHDDTLALMRECGVFLATSNRKEGWGATVNEAMAMGCCVIASEEMGSVPYLIKDGFNGLFFHGGDSSELAEKISLAFSDPEFAMRLGKTAKETMEGEWGPATAAMRFYQTSRSIVDGTPAFPATGPMSFA